MRARWPRSVRSMRAFDGTSESFSAGSRDLLAGDELIERRANLIRACPRWIGGGMAAISERAMIFDNAIFVDHKCFRRYLRAVQICHLASVIFQHRKRQLLLRVSRDFLHRL